MLVCYHIDAHFNRGTPKDYAVRNLVKRTDGCDHLIDLSIYCYQLSQKDSNLNIILPRIYCKIKVRGRDCYIVTSVISYQSSYVSTDIIGREYLW